MPLRMIHDEEIVRPFVTCEHCGREITRANEANFEWFEERRLTGEPSQGPFTILFLHKRCSDAYGQIHGHTSFFELGHLLIWLENGLGFRGRDRKDSEARALMLDALG